nr:MAG TPA: hypothetical protein [Caudoviricetes sp.]
MLINIIQFAYLVNKKYSKRVFFIFLYKIRIMRSNLIIN